MRYEDLQDFIACYNPANRHQRHETWHEQNNPEAAGASSAMSKFWRGIRPVWIFFG
ncbi:hypothetical protein [Methylomonas koyamae]|uniref:hypothetical protein n=1 Tax=Methylomonas koyamae TaxID=702114 RepID=UPI000ABEEEEB|nr:hypothetical protein [Methylomonas koyamae]